MSESGDDYPMTRSEKIQEEEANVFALALLMPEDLFMLHYNRCNWDLSEGNGISYLANTFLVSENAVIQRISLLSKLGVINKTRY